jgi:hypothetical protein
MEKVFSLFSPSPSPPPPSSSFLTQNSSLVFILSELTGARENPDLPLEPASRLVDRDDDDVIENQRPD